MTSAQRKIKLRTAGSIEPVQVRFALERRIPLGAVSLVVGQEGMGKTTWLMEMVARLSRGELPGELLHTPVHVIYATAEDAPESTLVPRLLAAGGDPSRVHFLEVEVAENGKSAPDTLTLPDDLPQLAERAKGIEARILMLDPLVGYLPLEVNSHRDQHVRRVLAPLAQLAAELGLAVIAVVHLNKGDGDDVLRRVGGSVGFTAAARSVLILGHDPDDPKGESGPRRVIAHAKCNVGPKAPSQRGQIEPRVIDTTNGTIETSRFIMLGETEQTARDLLARTSTSDELTARGGARDFLVAELASAPVLVTELKARAEGAGVAWRTVERAKKEVGGVAHKTAEGWVWTLKTAAPYEGNVGGLGGVGGVKAAKAAKAATPLDTPSASQVEKAQEELEQAFPGSTWEDQ